MAYWYGQTRTRSQVRSRLAMQLLIAMFITCCLVFGISAFSHQGSSVKEDSGGSAQPASLPEDPGPAGYGASVNPTGDPIGGGAGYSAIPSPSAAKFTVTSKKELLDAFSDARAGDMIYVPDDREIDMTGSKGIAVPAGIVLASGRGRDGSQGGLIFTNDHSASGYPVFMRVAKGTRITGLRFRGPDSGVRTSTRFLYSGLACSNGVEVDNCEIFNWPEAGTSVVDNAYGHFHHNYIHHCRRTGYGYGVAVSGGTALVEANLFNFNRHSIMGTRGYPVSSYEARYNVFETGCDTAQSCDMHGGNDVSNAGIPAGGTILIHHNTFKAIWNAVNIRGVPTVKCLIYQNWAYHDPDRWSTMAVFSQSLGNLKGHKTYEKMQVYDNWYGTKAPSDA